MSLTLGSRGLVPRTSSRSLSIVGTKEASVTSSPSSDRETSFGSYLGWRTTPLPWRTLLKMIVYPPTWKSGRQSSHLSLGEAPLLRPTDTAFHIKFESV